MKFGRLVVVFAVALAFGATAPASGATGGRRQVWVGQTSEGKRIRFELVKHDDGSVTLQEFDVGLTLTCSVDATTQDWGMGWGWGGRGPVVAQRHVTLDETGGSEILHLAGRIGVHHGSGTLVLRSAQWTADEQLQECSTGDLTWTVDRQFAAPSAVSLDVVVRVHVDADGDVTRTVDAT